MRSSEATSLAEYAVASSLPRWAVKVSLPAQSNSVERTGAGLSAGRRSNVVG